MVIVKNYCERLCSDLSTTFCKKLAVKILIPVIYCKYVTLINKDNLFFTFGIQNRINNNTKHCIQIGLLPGLKYGKDLYQNILTRSKSYLRI